MIPQKRQHLKHKHSFVDTTQMHVWTSMVTDRLFIACATLALLWLTNRQNRNSKLKVKGFLTKSNKDQTTYCNIYHQSSGQHNNPTDNITNILTLHKCPYIPPALITPKTEQALLNAADFNMLFHTHATPPPLKHHHSTPLSIKCCFVFTQHMKSSSKIRERCMPSMFGLNNVLKIGFEGFFYWIKLCFFL